ncbi:hypothetical protein [Bosea sp. Root483D1]|uniref:hypothetical protein n=1 Tax=Bosea sp. Root483D1 TaxID=1736544 RepID=UPI0012E3CBBA|nr:hypothetical protein [Bosea sp. Root483D1]
MVQPATVDSDRARGLQRAETWCNDCLHHAEISMEGLPEDLPIPDICLRLPLLEMRQQEPDVSRQDRRAL